MMSGASLGGDTRSMRVWLARYLEWLRVRNYSSRTADNTESSVGLFLRWCDERNVSRPEEVTKPILERYQRFLFHFRKDNGRPLSFRTQAVRLVPVRGFFRWLTRQNVIPSNPASDLEMPRREKRLPKHVLTITEVERVLALPPVSEPLGLRDRTILEVLYATGLRRGEVVALRLDDIDGERMTVMVRQGKGKKDRVVPLGERALAWVTKYLDEARPLLASVESDGALFLTTLGERLSLAWITERVRRYVEASKVGKKGACHLFRHTMATLMLEGGADVRFVQEMLGHAKLETTQLYTQVSIHKLREIHAATHPGARLRPHDETGPEETSSATAGADTESRAVATAELLSSLAAEAAEEDDAATV
jgi:integrase/recombinase XerD